MVILVGSISKTWVSSHGVERKSLLNIYLCPHFLVGCENSKLVQGDYQIQNRVLYGVSIVIVSGPET